MVTVIIHHLNRRHLETRCLDQLEDYVNIELFERSHIIYIFTQKICIIIKLSVGAQDFLYQSPCLVVGSMRNDSKLIRVLST